MKNRRPPTLAAVYDRATEDAADRLRHSLVAHDYSVEDVAPIMTLHYQVMADHREAFLWLRAAAETGHANGQ